MADQLVKEQPRPINRKEFLNYVWSASMALGMASGGGALLWFAYPRVREGEFGGEFPLTVDAIPATDAPPVAYDEGRFWLVNTPEGLLAIYKVCTHLGCLYKWADSNNRFECPCHGSKFTREGDWICGPAPRSLDRLVIQAEDDEGNKLAETHIGNVEWDASAGGPLPIPARTATIRIDTGERVLGKTHQKNCT